MKRALLLLLALLALPLTVPGAAADDDWRADWAEDGYFEFCDVRGDTLVLFEGVAALGDAQTSYWDDEREESVEITPKFEDGPRFDASIDGGSFRRVSLPSTLRYLGGEAFYAYHFSEFTLPTQLEVMECDAFVYCSFDVLRIEAALPAADILDGLYDCSVTAYEAPAEHPLYKTVDGVLFSKDGRTLISYPNARPDAHYDVPAGVERIESGAIHNENLKTISLPIGLQSIGDFAFSGCTRLQSIALPLTVRELGRDAFYCCVSLELVSLPEGLEAEKDTDGTWAMYYPDDDVFRGDNGDTVAGTGSAGTVDAPGRLYKKEEAAETEPFEAGLVRIFDTAEADFSYRYYRSGKTVYMGEYQNGRVALYEPLGGAYPGGSGYGRTLGWAAIADVQYLSPETLFSYAEVKPQGRMYVWWNHLPDYAYWTPWETMIPTEGRSYEATLFGAFVRFDDSASRAAFACVIQDAELSREPDGTGNVYGVVYNSDFMADIPLRKEPDGEAVRMLSGGTQVQIIAQRDAWYQVADCRGIGWVGKEQIKIVPEKQKEVAQ